MVDLSIVFCMFTIAGKPPFSYGFPMVFPLVIGVVSLDLTKDSMFTDFRDPRISTQCEPAH